MDWSQWWIAAFGLSSVALVNMRGPIRRWGPIMGMLSQPAWFWATWKAEQWGIFVLSVFYACSWGAGIYNGWIREDPAAP